MLIILLQVFFTLSTSINSGDILFSESKAQSIEEEKMIMLVFSGSDWCSACIRFSEDVLENESVVKKIEESYIIHIADFPRKKSFSKEKTKDNEALAELYNPDGIFPKIVLIDASRSSYQTIKYKSGNLEYFLNELRSYKSP